MANELIKPIITIIGLIILIVIALTAIEKLGLAAEYPTLNSYVNDHANILTPQEEQTLYQQIDQIEKQTSVEIAIVTTTTTNGEDRTMYANKIGEQNGVGKADSDNGIVILWSLDNEKGGSIATGRGIESIITDSKVYKIGSGSRPYFDKQAYYQGFKTILDGIQKELIKEEVQDTPQINKIENTIDIVSTPIKGSGILAILLALFTINIITGMLKSYDSYDYNYTPPRTYTTTRKHNKQTTTRKHKKKKKKEEEEEEEEDSTALALGALALASSIGSSSSGGGGGISSGGFGGFGGGGFGGGGGKW